MLAVSEPGDYALSRLGDDIDIRRDLPAYRIIHDGRNIAFKGDILELWKDDWQAFAFGCSFSLEDALRSGGIPLSYEQRGFGGAIYRTNLETVPSGSFSGPLIVSMRPIHRDRINDVLKISENLPGLHGLPVQVGNPAKLGVDLYSPIETLGKMSLAQDEEPVFWACGVTAHLALENAGLPIAVTHVSSRMLVTDIPIDSSLTRRVAFDD